MVSTKSLATAVLASLITPLVSASPMIGSLSTPATAAAGDNITATLSTSIYVQNWEDFSIIWGIAPTTFGGRTESGDIAVGNQIGYTALYKTNVSKLNNFTIDLTIPDYQPAGEWLIVAAVPYLVGASGVTGLRAFNSTINITN